MNKAPTLPGYMGVETTKKEDVRLSNMTEPLVDMISLLRPKAAGIKLMEAAGQWGVRRTGMTNAGFGIIMRGECWLRVDGEPPIRLVEGDFILLPACPAFTIGSDLEGQIVILDAKDEMACRDREQTYGGPAGEINFRQLGGYFQVDTVNRGLLSSLLPSVVHIKVSDPAASRAKRTIDTIVEETSADRPGRDYIVNRLVEILLVEALRYRVEGQTAVEQRGLLAGLSDPPLARALRRLHEDVAYPWSVEKLARVAGLSRSAFSARFAQKVGIPPVQYLINWRMGLAKSMLEREALPLESLAAAIGYQSASAFSTAFRREVGSAPSHFARAVAR